MEQKTAVHSNKYECSIVNCQLMSYCTSPYSAVVPNSPIWEGDECEVGEKKEYVKASKSHEDIDEVLLEFDVAVAEDAD